MIRITLDEPELARTRIALSPLWELVTSLYLLARPETPWPYGAWAERARAALDEMDARALHPLVAAPSRLPDFFAPTPRRPHATLEEELEDLRRTPAGVVREQIERQGMTTELAAFVARPSAALARLAEALAEYWERALAADWPRIEAVLEREVLRRARALAERGPTAVLEGLHPRIRWCDPVIEIEKWVDAEVGGEGVVLVPLVFSRGALMVSVDDPRRLTISYQAPGAAEVWEPPEREDGRLEVLLGRGRAGVLRTLHEPCTTAELALRLGMAPSTVSEHLGVLARAQLVTRTRAGRRVYYRVNATGESLLALLADAETRTLSA